MGKIPIPAKSNGRPVFEAFHLAILRHQGMTAVSEIFGRSLGIYAIAC